MLLKAIGFIAAVIAGFGLGRHEFQIRRRMALLTLVVAAVAHAMVKLTLPHRAIEDYVVGAGVYDTNGWFLMPGVALLETAGLWLPATLMRWSDTSTRARVTIYIVATAILSAVVYYFPFDVLIVNDEVLGPNHAQYEVGLVFFLPFALAGYILGWLQRRRFKRMGIA